MTQLREPLLLLSGAGLAAWIWDEMRQSLAASHETAVAERPGGDRASLVDYAVAALDTAPWERFAIVAHSSGGVIGTELARLAPERVSAFLAVSAVIPKPGASFVSSMPFPNRIVVSLAMRVAGTRPPDSAIRGMANQLDADTADRIVADFTPESIGLYRDKGGERRVPQRRGYVVTGRDNSFPASLQNRFARALDAEWEDRLDTGHLPMLEQPQAFAEVIERFLTHQPSPEPPIDAARS